MRADCLTDRVVLHADTALEAELMRAWAAGEVRFGSWTYECDRGWQGPSATCLSFVPKSPARLRREKWAAFKYRMRDRWRWLRSFRPRIVSVHHENSSNT